MAAAVGFKSKESVRKVPAELSVAGHYAVVLREAESLGK